MPSIEVPMPDDLVQKNVRTSILSKSISNVFNSAFDVIAEVPVDFYLNEVTDMLAITFFIAKLAVFNELTNIEWRDQIIASTRMSCTFSVLGFRGKQWIDQKLLDERRALFDARVDFYHKIALKQINLRGECLNDVLKPMLEEENPITRCTVAFFDVLLNKGAFEDYEFAEISVEKPTREFITFTIARLEKIWRDYYSDISEFLSQSNDLFLVSANLADVKEKTSTYFTLKPLDEVNFDIEEINSHSGYSVLDRCTIRCETNQYQFYTHRSELFRLDRNTQKQTHVAYGSIHNACVLENYLLFSDWGSITGDRHLYCSDLDGNNVREITNIISNKKRFIGLHNSSEDSVQGMVTRNSSAYVFIRRTEDTRYVDLTYRLFLINGEFYYAVANKLCREKKE